MKVKVAVIQDAPVFFDKEKTLQKIESLAGEQADKGCQLLLFPESFIPGYPRGFTFGASIGSRSPEGRKLYAEYLDNSIDLDKDRDRLEKIAAKHKVYLVIGVTERDKNGRSLFCSMLYISPHAGLLGVHRKIKPTGTERVVWSEAGGESLVSFDTKIGKLGGLICWENYMPLARMAMYQQGVEIYLAPTADARESWVTSMQHIALEGRCFVMGCNQYFNRQMYPEKYRDLLPETPEEICPGGSVIISPTGHIIAGPLWNKAGVLIAELNLDEIKEVSLDFDVTGHYARKDIFNYSVEGQPAMIKEPDESN
ncbi:carbon-nitrogen hydrolase family protein [Zeaxanthinibacter sp. PT1]|uniref:carbon-nitrogen hydrolase family protein n=1 Tax=Zeaxanthinibacter TaxID=561554 RepID=UPI00234AE052|nr:carbon-nitrogen hydrolase family protein [Zeaxanthinibacter sp. PT1]MDC6350314.1 carbon-nitrogen hydrolase family protein [Zeaxanthinibacter sp. PT1]